MDFELVVVEILCALGFVSFVAGAVVVAAYVTRERRPVAVSRPQVDDACRALEPECGDAAATGPDLPVANLPPPGTGAPPLVMPPPLYLSGRHRRTAERPDGPDPGDLQSR